MTYSTLGKTQRNNSISAPCKLFFSRSHRFVSTRFIRRVIRGIYSHWLELYSCPILSFLYFEYTESKLCVFTRNLLDEKMSSNQIDLENHRCVKVTEIF